MIRTKGQNMLRCSGQNVNKKLGRTKRQPQKKVRTKCQPQKKVQTKCQPLVGISSGWHFVRFAFCPTTSQKPTGSELPKELYKVNILA